MPSNHLILCHPLLLLPSIFPSIQVFSNESALCIRWPKYWSFSFNISPSNGYLGLISFRIDCFDLAIQGTLKSLLQQHSSKASILRCSKEGNGNPLQYSCPENPMDGGAWEAAVHGVAQSPTQLKWLSSSSSRKHIKKQRHYFIDKGPSSQGYGFSSGHVWMWELDYKESWAPKTWCF